MQATRYPRFYRVWQAASVIFLVCFFVMTGLFIWKANEHSKKENITPGISGGHSELTEKPCPKQPTLLDLPDPLPGDITEALETLNTHLNSLVKPTLNVPAISANVFYKGKVIWSEHYGSKAANKSEIPDDNTVYRIGSVTKIFPVLLLFKLYEQGIVSSVDDPLNKYVPEFGIKNPFGKDNVTLRQLANQVGIYFVQF